MADVYAIAAWHIKISKAALWEEAKGKMRAMVAVEGQCSAHAPQHADQRERWAKAEMEIEEFISYFEGQALHE